MSPSEYRVSIALECYRHNFKLNVFPERLERAVQSVRSAKPRKLSFDVAQSPSRTPSTHRVSKKPTKPPKPQARLVIILLVLKLKNFTDSNQNEKYLKNSNLPNLARPRQSSF